MRGFEDVLGFRAFVRALGVKDALGFRVTSSLECESAHNGLKVSGALSLMTTQATRRS